MVDYTSSRGIKDFFQPGKGAGFKKAAAVLLLLALLLLFNHPSAAAFLQQSEDTLLLEIEDYLKCCYLYDLGEEHFPLQSLQELPKIFQDPYSAFLDKERMAAFLQDLERILPGGIGISLEQKGAKVLVTAVFPASPAERAGIKSGDMIVSVDDNPVFSQTPEEVALRIRGERGSRVKLLINREGKVLSLTMIREKINLPLVEYSWEAEGIALLRVHSFGEGLAGKVARTLDELEKTGLQGLILDLRDNQGGYVEEALALCSLFTDGVLLNVREKDSTWQEIRGRGRGEPFAFPMVLLVNGGTASAGEIAAAALKENKAALLVGEATFGKGMMQTLFELEEEGCLKLTTAEFTSPLGRAIEGCGVEPQYLVPAGDEQLELALELVRSRLGSGKEAAYWQPLRLDKKLCYPLRAVLQQTGRGIAAGEPAGIYLFYWNNILYRLDLDKNILSWVDHSNTAGWLPVFLYGGSTYVQETFLEEIMELPFY